MTCNELMKLKGTVQRLRVGIESLNLEEMNAYAMNAFKLLKLWDSLKDFERTINFILSDDEPGIVVVEGEENKNKC